jgi:hypothetical protein
MARMTNEPVLHSRRAKRLGAATLLALSLALPRVASAQVSEQPAAAAPSPHQRETARAWVLEGRELFAQKEYAKALERFRGAYQLVRVPTTGIEVARAQAALGQWVEANASAVEVFNLPRAANEPEVYDVAREQARELRRGLAPRIPALRLDVTPQTADLQIQIDGSDMPRGSSGMSFKLNPGQHTIRVRAPGYREELRAFELAEKENRVLLIVLRSEPAGALGEVASTGVPPSSQPAASDSTGAVPLAQPSGNDAASVSAAAPARAWVALSVAGAAALVGSVTGVLAFTSKPSCPGDVCDPSLRDEADRSLLYGNVASVSFGVAVVAGAYGLYALLSNEAPSPSAAAPPSRALLRPSLVPLRSGAVLHLAGNF